MCAKSYAGSFFVVLVTVGAFVVPEQASRAQQCEGPTFQYHGTKPLPFDTNSHLEYGNSSSAGCISKSSKSQRSDLWRVDRCVYNPDDKVDFHFSWFVPDWESYVPPHCALEYPHFLDAENPKVKPKVDLITSCIEYGNAGQVTTAQYLGDEHEKDAAAKEDESKCRSPSAPTSSSDPDLRTIDFDIELFFPSDSSKAEETMLAMEGHYTLVTKGDEAYFSQFSYKLVPAREKSKGDPEAITMKTQLSGKAEPLSKFRTTQNIADGVRLTSGGEVPLLGVPGKAPWQLVQGTLDFLDGFGKRVARAQIPLFAPGQ